MQTDPKYWFPANATDAVGAFPTHGKAGWIWPSSSRYLLSARSSCHRQTSRVVSACLAMLCGPLIGVCWLKGKPPRWRWDGDNEG